jgi:hypothetical protein
MMHVCPFPNVLHVLIDMLQVYIHYARFSGINGPINCLLFNQDGTLLAGGGTRMSTKSR